MSFGEQRAHMVIQDGRKSRPSIVCVPGAGDSVARFSDLAAAIGEEWPVHGMQPRGLDGDQAPHSCVQAAAAAYLSEIEAICKGPVHLLGHSFGGWVAFEMALRMTHRGIVVASVTVVDSEAPGSDGSQGREYTPLQVISEYIQLVELSAQRPLDLELRQLEALEMPDRISVLHKRMVALGVVPERSTADMLQGPLRTVAAALRTSYLPSTSLNLPIDLVLVPDSRVSEQANQDRQRDALEGWKRFAPKTRVFLGPGNHMTILKPPHVHVLAQWWLRSDGRASQALQDTILR